VILRRARGAFVCVAGLLAAGCAQLPEHPHLPPQTALGLQPGAALDRALAGAEASHPGASGFRLVVEGMEAFAIRLQSARQAERSIDVQTYIWHADTTGLTLAHELLQAADRGVRVRLLVDDVDARAKNAGFAALDAHPNIEVRVFNPFASRSGSLQMVSEGVRNFSRINRRMHNKSWIADNRVALVGGRNLGDEYFSASDEVNFIDLDFAMVGPVVRDVSASFDRFWNSDSAWPIALLDAKSVTPEALQRLRTRLDENAALAAGGRYAQALRENDGIRRLVAGDGELQWSTNYRFVSDDPAKVSMDQRDASRAMVGAAIVPLIRNAQQSLRVISPYFVPGEQGSAGLVERVKAGAQVQVLTNSLAANDVATVHGGYSRHRKQLVEGGVQVWELKPTRVAGQNSQEKEKHDKKSSSFSGSSGASLHTKAMSADDRELFVGSYNLDPRSTWLNCEQGVFVEDAVLATQLGKIFELQTTGSRAWRVTLEDGKLRWNDGVEKLNSEPSASWWRRFQAWFARTFELDAQL
jgi:putative cardiolipin synthase